MKMQGTHSLAARPEDVYELLMRPDILTDCIPGCQELVPTGEGIYAMKMKVVLAALSGDFTGKVAIEDPNPPHSYRMKVEGKGRLGFMNGSGELQFTEPTPGHTLVSFQGDVQIGGTFAAVGQRLVDTTARMMIRRFFDKLATHFASPTP